MSNNFVFIIMIKIWISITKHQLDSTVFRRFCFGIY